METDLSSLRDCFEISYNAFETSRIEDREVRDMFHNRQYDRQQKEILRRRGQPAETFNIIKLFARLLVGYYSTVVNTVKVKPAQESDVLTALLLHDIVQFTFEKNHFETEGEKIKLDGVLSGLMCVYEDVTDTGKKDDYGRPIRRVELSHVPSLEILLDPMSTKEDYSDARFVHRFKWVSEDYLKNFIRKEKSESEADGIIDRLEAYDNFVNKDDTDFSTFYSDRFTGIFRQHDNYLLIHTVIVDDDGKVWV